MRCKRCGGFLVFDHFCGTVPYEGFRCINCGEMTNMRIVTPVRGPERPIPKWRPKGGSAPSND